MKNIYPRRGSTFNAITVALLIPIFICGLGCGSSAEPETPKNFSTLVYPGVDGSLVYAPDETGNIIPDFSNAGYMGGGVKLPDVPVRVTVKPGLGNDAARIQSAIDTISGMQPDKNGIRGAVLLKKGRYVLDGSIVISAGGVVLRGEGQDENGTVLFGAGVIKKPRNESTLIFVRGSGGPVEMENTARRIADERVPVGARSFNVENSAGYKAGDTIIVRRFASDDWFRTLELDIEHPTWQKSTKTHDFDRIITQIENNRITVDAPITCAIESEWGGGEIVKYTDRERIANVGIENLCGISDYNKDIRSSEYGNMDRTPYIGAEYYSDQDHYWNFIIIDNTANAWVKNVTAYHFAGSLVTMDPGSKWVTVQDCTSLEPVSITAGGRRFTYQISGQLCLVQRCYSDKGRHSFVLGGHMTCGPNVFLDCVAERPYSSSEPHSSLVVGSLYDNVHAPIAFRFATSALKRWMGINSFAWNCEGMFITQKPPTAQTYSIGHIGVHAMIFNRGLIDYSWEDGYIESLDEHVSPRSLYLKQLEDRLGKNAVRNIASEKQIRSLK